MENPKVTFEEFMIHSHFVLSSPRKCSRVLETRVFGSLFELGLG